MDNVKKKIKIIQICAIDGTMDILLRELYKISVKEGYEVIGICSYGEKTKKLIDEGFNIKNINIDRSINIIGNFKTVIQLYKFFKKEKPDIVHVHTPVAAVLGRVASKLARVPLTIYTAHGFYFHENMSKLAYTLCFNIEKFMGRFFTDYIFTQSSEDAEVAKKNKFLPKNKILAIGNGVDVFGKFNKEKISSLDIENLKREFDIKEDDKVVSFIGRMVREKGILDLLEGFNSLEDENVKLLVVGDVVQGDRDIECSKLIEKYRNDKNIIFTGKRSDINVLLHISDVFCLPSYREGMPRSIIEAMASECAVIATNIRGSREEVVNGVTGYLVDLNSPKQIKEKIEILINNEKVLESMKEKGRIRSEELYDEKKVVYKQLSIFNKLLEEKGLI